MSSSLNIAFINPQKYDSIFCYSYLINMNISTIRFKRNLRNHNDDIGMICVEYSIKDLCAYLGNIKNATCVGIMFCTISEYDV